MKTILVTGGAGFIGSHLTDALVKKGYHVTVLDNLVYGKREWVSPKATFIHGDICDIATCRSAMQDIDVVFHCAAMSRSAPSFDAIELCTRVNVVGTQNVLLAARDVQVEKFIYSGSSTYYGNNPTPHKEYDTPSQFLNAYALSKYVGEKYVLMFNEIFNIPSVIFRYFNVYGTRQPAVGPYALVLGTFLQRAAQDKPLEIHGTGEQRRDFIHIDDVVAANLAILESDIQHEIFNVGSGENISIKDLANLISSNQTECPKRPADVDETLADISLIKEKLSWHPKISLEQGVQELLSEIKNVKHKVM